MPCTIQKSSILIEAKPATLACGHIQPNLTVTLRLLLARFKIYHLAFKWKPEMEYICTQRMD
jgi:hypothetical protein